ncbi:MAG: CAP domain-containing protein [Sandaracinus sp.]
MRSLRLSLAVTSLLALAGCSPSPGGACMLPTRASCVAQSGSRIPLDLSSSTAMEADDFAPSCGAGAGGRDVAFEFTAPEAGRYEISTAGSSFDTVLSVRRGCDGAEITCNDDVRPGMDTRSAVSVDLEACETVVIVVDAFGPSEAGDVQLHVTARESACDDGLDNDGDGAPDCADTDCFSQRCSGTDDWPMAYQDFEWRVLTLTNERRAAGATCDMDVFGPAPALEMDTVIRVAARGHSTDMGEQAYFEHDSLDGRTFADRMTMAGFMGPTPWGENIAAGQSTPEEVVDGWMHSPGHCRNIMNPDYRTIGIGYAFVDGSPYGHYWTQDFAAGH